MPVVCQRLRNYPSVRRRGAGFLPREMVEKPWESGAALGNEEMAISEYQESFTQSRQGQGSTKSSHNFNF